MSIHEKIAQARLLAERASAPPWGERFIKYNEEWPDGRTHLTVCAHGPLHKAHDPCAFDFITADMKFIAESRMLLPALAEALAIAVGALEEVGCDCGFETDREATIDSLCISCEARTKITKVLGCKC